MTYFPPVNTAAERSRSYPRYQYEGVPHENVVNVPHVFNTLQTLEQLVGGCVAAIGSRAVARPPRDGGIPRSTVLVNLPCMFRSLHNPRHVDDSPAPLLYKPLNVMSTSTHSAPKAVATAALGIAFPPMLEAMAATMLRTLRAGGMRFNGLVASDPTDLQALLGRNHTRLRLLLTAARTYFGAPSACYLGMEWLHDVQGQAHLDMQGMVVSESPCTSLVTKYQLLDASVLHGAVEGTHMLLVWGVLLNTSFLTVSDFLTTTGISHYFSLLAFLCTRQR